MSANQHTIFNEQGFLNKEGRAFLNDGFIKETKRILATAQNDNDLLIISGILKAVVADCAFAMKEPPAAPVSMKETAELPKGLVEALTKNPPVDMLHILSSLTDIPPMDID